MSRLQRPVLWWLVYLYWYISDLNTGLKCDHIRARFTCLCLVALIPFCSSSRAADANLPGADPVVTVHRSGDNLSVDMNVVAPVPVAIAWAVLTDFESMARFIPNLSASSALSEGPNLVRVTQKGTAVWGPLSFDFESVRRVALQPMSRIETTALSGKISKMTSVSELRATDKGVHIHYHANAQIDFWLPPLLGTSAMQHETREQFTAMIAEMLRRNALH